MSIEAPYPEFDEILTMFGEVGHRMSEINATEGAAGNISVYVGWSIEPRRRFPIEETIQLPEPVPALANKSFIVTGSGRRLREIIQDPTPHLGFLIVNDGGTTARLFTAPDRRFTRLTSELNSHLALHEDKIARTGTNFHAVIHAQPPHLTFLSHIPAYRDERYLNQHILRWEPESIVNLPEGVGHVPFHVPGSPEQAAGTLEALRHHRLVIWGTHGVVACSDVSVKRASDLIEYAETGAHYEVMNLSAQERGEGLTLDEIRAICVAFHVSQNIF
ncbi:MAG TPA: class II aldolase/adducin family protein [Aggregatilineales bacterium]|nr:class II aldolase/adducin family protein [Aggregatilineales bacterium]